VRFVEALAAFLLRLSERGFRATLVLVAAALAFGLPHVLPLRIDNTLDTLLEQGTADERDDREIKAAFGDLDEVLILVYHDERLFSAWNLGIVREATERRSASPACATSSPRLRPPLREPHGEGGSRLHRAAPAAARPGVFSPAREGRGNRSS
jgi:hypothetical protein